MFSTQHKPGDSSPRGHNALDTHRDRKHAERRMKLFGKESAPVLIKAPAPQKDALLVTPYDEEHLAQVKACWWTLFSELVYNLTDSDQPAEQSRRRVEVAADLADMALEQYEKRWGVRGQ